MKVLMVSNIYPTKYFPGRGSFVKGQVESIRKEGVDVTVEYVNAIDGRIAFPRSALRIFKRSFTDAFDLVHAHYGTTGIISRLQWNKPVVVSYLGSDLLGDPKETGSGKTAVSRVISVLCRLNALAVNAVIVKSDEMRRLIPRANQVYVVPNGVDFQMFRPTDKGEARKKLGLDAKKKYVLFPSNPVWKRKGYGMAQEVVRLLQRQKMNVELLAIYGQSQTRVPEYMNAADAMVMTSLWEGSPNVVKESMACNLPVVSVDVGDVRQVIEGCEGCAVVSRDAADMAEHLKIILQRPERTPGRDHIRHLEMQTVARRIIRIYRDILRVKSPS